MTDQSATAEKGDLSGEPSPEREKSFWASFTAADMRGLIVGVIGGLLVVIIVALALIVNRHLGHVKETAGFYLGLSGGLAILLILSMVAKGWLRTTARVLFVTLLGLIVVLGALLFLGEAAGIH